jgi:hypothetical protein
LTGEAAPGITGTESFFLIQILENHDKDSLIKGTLSLRSGNGGYRLSREMIELTVVFGFNTDPFVMEIRAENTIIWNEQYSPSESLVKKTWSLPGSPAGYSLTFAGTGTPEIYSVSVDDRSGVAVDNVPLRGSSGLEFSRTDMGTMKQMIEELNVGLLLLQFGVNLVPDITDDYSFYENSFLRQLRFLKSLDQGLDIIVIGVSDMSLRIPGGHYESYPNIEMIRDAQRNAAFRAGVPFWDLYSAMGGRNSMPSWVEARPSLAQRDFVHFTHRGSTIVGDLLFNAIISEYEIYLNRALMR